MRDRARTLARSVCVLAALLLAAVLCGCSGNTNPGATAISATSATLQANVNCARGELCAGYFRWRVLGTSAWTNGAVLGPVAGPSSRTIGYTARLSSNTTYDYQYCGVSSKWHNSVCVGPTDAQPPSGQYSAGDQGRSSTFTTLRSTPTITAQQFSDSIGVNDAIINGNQPLYINQNQAAADMKALGITHVRAPIVDWSNSGGEAYFLSKFETLQRAGLKIDALVSQACTDRHPAWDIRNPADCIGVLRLTAGLRGVEAFEEPNEADIAWNPNWANELRPYDQAIYSAVKQAGNFPVYGPSLVFDSSPRALGNQSGTFDFENFHDYTGATSANPDAVAYQFSRQVPLAGLKPAVSTETGYHNAVGCSDSCQPGIDLSGAAIYTLRTYLEHLADGVKRTYVYELFDEPTATCAHAPCQNAHFGLIDGTGAWKPAAHALANLTAMIGSAAPATVRPLHWGVAAGDHISDLRYLDIEKPDGSHDLVLWRTCTGPDKLTCPASVWNPIALTSRVVAPVTIHVVGSFSAWSIADPIISPFPLRGSGPIALQLRADPIVLHVTPS